MAYIYTRFDTTDDIVQDISEVQTAPIWSGNVGTMTTFFTSSAQSASSGDFYMEIKNADDITDSTAITQFSIAYGHFAGSGSVDFDNISKPGVSPSRAIYHQYANMLLPDSQNKFIIGSSYVEPIYVININRARFKEQIDPGNWQLNLNANGGKSSDILHLIDDSDSATSHINEAGRIYNIVSGSITDGPYSTADAHVYGQVYVDQGVMILDAGDLRSATNQCSQSFGGNDLCDNLTNFFKAITGSANYATPTFTARNKEEVKSTHYFVRVKNQAYNYSDNPTFVTGSDSTLRYADFKDNPNTYITTVGLYDDSDNCLAIAKLSKPLLKSFSREALIKVKLEY